MSVIYLLLGIVLLVIGIVDFIWTTLWVDGGAGPVTKRLSALLWRAMKKLGRANSRLFSWSGPLTLMLALSTWIFFLWAGWTLVFAGNPSSITDTQDNNPISWGERIYFAGYLIFTLGNGDYSPNEGIWQFAATLATATGLLFITLGVTYLLSVLGAVSQKHALAESIHGLGKNGVDIVLNSWNGRNFHDIDLLLNSFANQLSAITSQHNAYPVLHYYHADKAKETLPVAVTALDEALTIYLYAIPEELLPNGALLKETRATVHSYLETLRSAYIEPSSNNPPLIDLYYLREAGLRTVSDDKFLDSLSDLQERRRLLLAVLEENNRQWPEKSDK
ncbi:ion channel [Planococcus salinus]|uniref:Two pore domain potassium channel family protein n=1 Tax=Planococcus salinus TaxID=1848460 RepID=A0A3M8PBV5_9BACL|nr:ion channel [Planococcus salinus]RNF41187.1 two pore domain potassium channel family protein [Planococcus salinus]